MRIVLDVQAELLLHPNTRVVVPLLPEATAPPAVGGLRSVFEIEGRPYVMMTQALGAVSNPALEPAVAPRERGRRSRMRPRAPYGGVRLT